MRRRSELNETLRAAVYAHTAFHTVRTARLTSPRKRSDGEGYSLRCPIAGASQLRRSSYAAPSCRKEPKIHTGLAEQANAMVVGWRERHVQSRGV